MGCTSGGGVKRAGGAGVNPNDILSERDMIVERGQNQKMVDDVLNVSRDMMNEYGVNGEIGEFLIAEMKPKASAIAYYDGVNIAVNQKYFNEKTINEAYKECVKSGYHPNSGKKSAMEAVASHEFGHALTDAVGRRIGEKDIHKTADRIVKEAKRKTKHRGVVQFADKISRYATAANAECVAEAVCDVYCNGNKAKAESKAVVGVIKGYLK